MDTDAGSFAASSEDGGGAASTPGLRRRLAAGTISAVGLVLLGVPAYDIWDDDEFVALIDDVV